MVSSNYTAMGRKERLSSLTFKAQILKVLPSILSMSEIDLSSFVEHQDLIEQLCLVVSAINSEVNAM